MQSHLLYVHLWQDLIIVKVLTGFAHNKKPSLLKRGRSTYFFKLKSMAANLDLPLHGSSNL